MSELTRFRDHATAMAIVGHRPDCKGRKQDRWGGVIVHPDPKCGGCITPAERDLWRRLADEVDAYLDQPAAEDLFGELTAEPMTEAAAGGEEES